MGKLGNYILNVFLSFVLLFVAIFFFTAELYLIAVMIVLALLVYLLLCDIYFPSIGNIKNFAFTEKDIRKKLLAKIFYLSLYIAIVFLAGHISAYILLLFNLLVGLDIICLLIKKKRFFFYLFRVDL